MVDEISEYYKTAQSFLDLEFKYFEKIIELNKIKKESITLHKDWFKLENEKNNLLTEKRKFISKSKEHIEKRKHLEDRLKEIDSNISKFRKKAEKKKVDIDHCHAEAKSLKKDIEEGLKTINRVKPPSEVRHPPVMI